MKIGTSFRLSPPALEIIEKLAEQLGVSKTSVIEIAVRNLAGGQTAKHSDAEAKADRK
jgi:predicted DNA-binding protein